MASNPITQYIPKKFDHIARLTNIIKGSTYKHHGVIIQPDTTDIFKSHVIHFYGNTKTDSTIYNTTLKDFMEDHKQLVVYDHSSDLLDEKTIEENIKKFSEKKNEDLKYDLFKFNCEDVACQILLKENHSHKKQADNHTYWRLSKIGYTYALTHYNWYSLPKDLTSDPDTNPKTVYML
jgi:hypothetical protein